MMVQAMILQFRYMSGLQAIASITPLYTGRGLSNGYLKPRRVGCRERECEKEGCVSDLMFLGFSFSSSEPHDVRKTPM